MTSHKRNHSPEAEATTPLWWQQTSIYQIYPRSFQDSNGDGIGDLAGIRARLDYLQQLGVETIWLSPFFASPQSDWGYDISDYYAVAPEYGDLATVDALIDDVHARGMYILFDLVLNHTSDQHPWFRESAQDRTNARHDWYLWRDGQGVGKPPNHWQSMLGRRGWHYVPARDQWYFASFLPFQPDLNYRNPAVKAAMFAMVRHWLEKGVDGFRLDIFNVIFKDAQLRDNPLTWNPLPRADNPAGGFRRPLYTTNRPETIAFARELRALIDRYTNPPRMVIGEVFGEHGMIKRYLGGSDGGTVSGGESDSGQSDGGRLDGGTVGGGLNLIFLFDLLHFQFTAAYFRETLRLYEREYDAPLTPTYVFSNHDVRRSIGRVGGNHDKAKLLALLQMTVRGVAVLYQGEEIGMSDTPLPKATALDPVSHLFAWVPQWLRKFMPQLLNRDECRTPMQWLAAPNGGFTTGEATPWLPLNPNYQEINVAAQQDDPNSLLNTYRQLLALRRQLPALQSGYLQLVTEGHNTSAVLIYRRITEANALTVYINFSDHPQPVSVDHTNSQLLFTTNQKNQLMPDGLLQPLSGMIVCS